MPQNPLSTVFLACSLLFLLIAWELVVRRQSSDTAERPARPTPKFVFFPSWICAFLCCTGGILLFPWATLAPAMGLRGAVPGMLFIALLATGTLYALYRQ